MRTEEKTAVSEYTSDFKFSIEGPEQKSLERTGGKNVLASRAPAGQTSSYRKLRLLPPAMLCLCSRSPEEVMQPQKRLAEAIAQLRFRYSPGPNLCANSAAVI